MPSPPMRPVPRASRKRLWATLLFLLLVLGLLWYAALEFYNASKIIYMQSWFTRDQQLVKNTAQASRDVISRYCLEDQVSLAAAKNEVVRSILKPQAQLTGGDIHLLINGEVTRQDSDQDSKIPAGRTARQVLLQTSDRGGTDLSGLLQSIAKGGEGVAAFPQTGQPDRLRLAWASFKANRQTWTVLLIRDESSLKKPTSLALRLQHNLTGAAAISFFIIAIFAYYWIREKKHEKAVLAYEAESVRHAEELSQANTRLTKELEQRQQAQDNLAKSELKYRTLIETAAESIVVVEGANIRYANPAACLGMGYSFEEMINKPFLEFIHPDDHALVLKQNQRRMAGEELDQYVMRIITKRGKVLWVEVNGAFFEWEGNPASIVLLNNITKRHQAEQAMRQALSDKEVLLQEIHHRVKNNLQVIDSLLQVQANSSPEPAVREALYECHGRVRAVGLVHELLHRTGSDKTIDFADYAVELARGVLDAMNARINGIHLDFDLGRIEMDLDRAITLGLVLNELLTNVVKHAYPDDGPGTVTIRGGKQPDGTIEIQFSDDGCGIPSGIDWHDPKYIGLYLISGMLEKQLHGSFQVNGGQGTRISIKLPAQAPES